MDSVADIALRHPTNKICSPRKMLGSITNALRRRKFKAGAELVRFIAPDIKREIRVIDDSGVAEGYVVAQVRTFNVLHKAKGLERESEFQDPEILQIDQAWDWGGAPWGGEVAKRPRTPLITAEQFARALQARISGISLESYPVNPDYDSWRIEASLGTRTVEFAWGPLSGFGGIDPSIESEDPFGYCDEYLFSIDSALEYAERCLGINKGEQAEDGDASQRPC